MATIFDISTGEIRHGPDHGRTCLAAAWDLGRSTCITGGLDGGIRAWDFDGNVVWSREHESPVAFLAVDFASTRVAAGHHDGSVEILDVGSGTSVRTVGLNGPALEGTWSVEGTILLIDGPRGCYALVRSDLSGPVGK